MVMTTETVHGLRRALRAGVCTPIAMPHFIDVVRAAAATESDLILEQSQTGVSLPVQIVLMAGDSAPDEYAFIGRVGGRIVTVSVSRSYGVVPTGRPQAICTGWPCGELSQAAAGS